MQKQKDRIYFVVAQIVADGDQDVAKESVPNHDAKEGIISTIVMATTICKVQTPQ